MNLNHFALFASWMMFAVIHSVFASQTVKRFFETAMGPSFRFYRPGYSVFAFMTLIAVLIFQFLLPSTYLFHPYALKYVTGLPLAGAGLIMMGVCTRKYFRRLSGVRPDLLLPLQLETAGIHRYVRHPLYLGTLIFIWSLFLICPLRSNAIAVLTVTGYTLIGMKAEEAKLIRDYGEQYLNYKASTPALIPRLRTRLIRILFR